MILTDQSSELVFLEVPTTLSSNQVFIVHGHDILGVHELKDILKDQFGLEPIVMFDEPASGRTLIEKFEEEAARASYAFILMTPDDRRF